MITIEGIPPTSLGVPLAYGSAIRLSLASARKPLQPTKNKQVQDKAQGRHTHPLRLEAQLRLTTKVMDPLIMKMRLTMIFRLTRGTIAHQRPRHVRHKRAIHFSLLLRVGGIQLRNRCHYLTLTG